MAKPPAKKNPSVSSWLKALPADRRATIARVRKVIREHLPDGYCERVALGMLCYEVPLAVLPDTYNGQPLWYAALASTKSYCSLHLMAGYGSAEELGRIKEAFRSAGKKLDMGKACIHFQTEEDLPLDAIGASIARFPLAIWIDIYQKSRAKTVQRK